MQRTYIRKHRVLLVFTCLSVGALVIATINPLIALAATTPALGAAESYGVLSTTYVNGAGATINGSVGFTVAPATVPLGSHPNYGSGAPYATAGLDQNTALSELAAQSPCTFTWGAAVDLSTDGTHGTVGLYSPGIYCSNGAMSASGPLVFSGDGTYIFRAVGALNTTAGSSVTLLNDASACDIFWTPTGATSLGASSSFVGTVIEDTADITTGASSTWLGRALAFDGAVTTGAASTINVPDCTSLPDPELPATLHVIKQVVNDNGKTAVMSDFNLYVKQAGVDAIGSPAAGASAPGTAYSLVAGIYTISEDANLDFDQTFSGDCDTSGNITLIPGGDSTCIVTNDDIASITSSGSGDTPDPTPVDQPAIPGLPDTGWGGNSIGRVGLGIIVVVGIVTVAIFYGMRRFVRFMDLRR